MAADGGSDGMCGGVRIGRRSGDRRGEIRIIIVHPFAVACGSPAVRMASRHAHKHAKDDRSDTHARGREDKLTLERTAASSRGFVVVVVASAVAVNYGCHFNHGH